MAQLVVIAGPIAAGKNSVASLVADGLTALGRLTVLVDVDDVAAMVAAPGAAAAGLWFAAHQAHGALVGTSMRAAVDIVIAIGPIYTPASKPRSWTRCRASTVHWVVIDAPVAVTLARPWPTRVAGFPASRCFIARLTGGSVSCCPRFLLPRPSTPHG